jgi:divinyl protochlorophyllide a 8-vinyl-reductase
VAVAISKWRTSDDVRADTGVIGPNAILQLLPLLEDAVGARETELLLRHAHAHRPSGEEMIPEGEAARLHHTIRNTLPDVCNDLAKKSGIATADYILAHRIPKPAQVMLKLLPPGLAARALSRAITAHAWTFAGSGSFEAVTPWSFEIENNPLIRGERSETPLCVWHAAVFGRLYQKLVHPKITCREITCAAQGGHGCCRFELYR